MVIGCPSCHARFRLDPARIPPGGRALKCGRCATVFHAEAPASPAREISTLTTIGCARPQPVSRPALHAVAAAGGAAVAGAMTASAVTSIATEGAPAPGAAVDPSGPSRAPAADAATAAEAPSTPGTGEPTWLLCNGSGDEGPVDRARLRELIRQGEIEETTPLRAVPGGEPLAAGEIPDLQRYFRLRQENAATAAHVATPCVVHATRPAAFVCPHCQGLFCALCVAERQFGTKKMPWCRRCDDRCLPYEGVSSVVPFWRRVPQLLRYPLEGWGPFMILCCALLSFLGAMLPGPGKALYFFVLAYQLHILKESSEGKERLPDWPDLTDLAEITGRGMKAVVVTAIAWLPVLGFNYFFLAREMPAWPAAIEAPAVAPAASDAADGEDVVPAVRSEDGTVPIERFLDENGQFDFEKYQAAQAAAPSGDPGPLRVDGLSRLARVGLWFILGNLALILVIGAYFPMCLMIAAIFNTVAPALNPAVIARCISRIKADYAMALVFCGLLLAAGIGARLALSIVPFAGAALSALLSAYLMFIQMHILGWTAHQGRDRLNWDIRI